MKKITVMFLILSVLLTSSPVYSMAEENNSEEYANIATNNYSTIIMQGNTDSAADCYALRNSLMQSGYGYNTFACKGWSVTNGGFVTLDRRVRVDEFQTMGNYHVAYYSGHGGYGGSWNAYWPKLNAITSNAYGSYAEINVAEALQVDGDDWASACIIKPTDNLRVLFLAACNQLNDSVVKYYARLMKASGVRVIAGYSGTGPGHPIDVNIANQFIEECAEGTSIRLAWDSVNDNNGNRPWAVLVYITNENHNYRLPGFPGSTCPAPGSTASVYRYMSTSASANSVPLTQVPETIVDIYSTIETLPLSITVVTSLSNDILQSYNREPVWNTAVLDSKNTIDNFLGDAMDENFTGKPCSYYKVSREEIDTEVGVIPESEVVVERTYKYFDTYRGVKIADSFVSASVDGNGINNVTIQRKTVVSEGVIADKVAIGTNTNSKIIQKEDALKLLLLNHSCIANSELIDISLAYVPDGSGNHVLCYEFIFSGESHYVNVATGDVVYF